MTRMLQRHASRVSTTTAATDMDPLDLVRLRSLMARNIGNPNLRIGLVDGPVMTNHPDLAGGRLEEVGGQHDGACTDAKSAACLHGTFIAGILSARRDCGAPAICPGCTLVTHSIFPETASAKDELPSAAPRELAFAILDCIRAGARIVNLSLALVPRFHRAEPMLEETLNLAARRGVIVVAAAGNQGSLGSSVITRHPWVIPVVACDLSGHPLNGSNLGRSVGTRGLSAPGDRVTSLAPGGQTLTMGGTSVAAPFVTGTIALLWSEFPSMSAAQIKLAVMQSAMPRRGSVVPGLLNAAAAYRSLLATRGEVG